jgi:subtilisin family serine protease
MDEQGNGSPASYTECFEWAIAPYPIGGDPATQGDPTKAADVVNNSWYCPPSEGCNPATLQAVVANVRAAGTVVVASAGNDGPGCSSLRYPPALYADAFSVGASDRSRRIASFSSRGPVTADGSNRRKPDITAPGVDVWSSVPTNSYATLSGTSMAGPHVVGVVALILSAKPALRGDADAIESLLERGALPKTTTQGCGGDSSTAVPNNVWGYGLLNAFNSVNLALARR